MITINYPGGFRGYFWHDFWIPEFCRSCASNLVMVDPATNYCPRCGLLQEKR